MSILYDVTKINFIYNIQGLVVGDYVESEEKYGFQKNGKTLFPEDTFGEERQLLLNLVDKFFIAHERQVHNGYEYSEINEYRIYRKVLSYMEYKDLIYDKKPVDDNMYIKLILEDGDSDEEYFILITTDEGFAKAVVRHFQHRHKQTVRLDYVEAEDELEAEYFNHSIFFGAV